MPTLLVAHLHFFKPHKAKQKNAKEPPSQRTKKRHEMTTNNHFRKEGEVLTSVLQNGGFSASVTV